MNERHTPPSIADARCIVRGLLAKLMRYDADYRWLHASGYTQPHASGGQIGDPAELQVGSPPAIRYRLRRAAGHVDDAVDAMDRALDALDKVEQLIDQDATPGGIDEDLGEASAAEIRQARRQKVKRDERASHDAAPWAGQEITG